jgi:hypothetical protein
MGATKESPATQVLEWAVGKLSEASKTDWVDKLSTLAASRPAYLRDGRLMPRPAPGASAGASRGELDAALDRAARAEAENRDLARRVTDLEAELNALRSAPAGGDNGEEHKAHWWSRHH